MKQLSIIIPYHNDIETLVGTLDSLYATIDIDNFEVIVINDASSTGKLTDVYELQPNMKHIDHFFNIGVGQAFDTGVRQAESPNLILMGADIRFKKNKWAGRMLKVLQKHHNALIATTCGSTESVLKRYGADVMFKVRQEDLTKSHPRKHIPQYKSILEGKWRPRTGRGVYPVPCLMGAFYGVKRAWYQYLRGFELHYRWGVLEPYISLKSWRLGGEVLVDTENITYHMFNRSPQRTAQWDVLAYNQIIIAQCVFGRFGIKYVEFLCETPTEAYNTGAGMTQEKYESINQLSAYIEENAVMPAEELEKKMVEMSYHYNQDSCKYLFPLDDITKKNY